MITIEKIITKVGNGSHIIIPIKYLGKKAKVEIDYPSESEEAIKEQTEAEEIEALKTELVENKEVVI